MFEFLNIHPYIVSTLLALGLGAVIGLERETVMQRGGTPGVAGIRTFAFIAMMGALSGILGELTHIAFAIAGFASIFLLVAIAYYGDQKRNRVGLTTEITSLITFAIGALAAYEQAFLAVATTIAVITVLALRQYLHRFAKELDNHELFAGIQFAIIAFIILPLLPNETIDQWDALNPYKIWLIVVLISGLNFAGYILNQIFGERKGMAMTGFFGGFVSSTAVNLTLAEESKEKKGVLPIKVLLLALFLAQAASLMLTQLELFVLNRELFFASAPALTTAIVALLGFSYYSYKTCTHKKTAKLKRHVNIKSPFTLREALIFGGIFSAMMLTIKILFQYIGDAGLYITSIFSGLISLDAMTVTMAEVTGTTIELTTGMQVLLIGVIMSIIQKIVVLIFLAEKKFKIQGSIFLIITSAILGAFAYFA